MQHTPEEPRNEAGVGAPEEQPEDPAKGAQSTAASGRVKRGDFSPRPPRPQAPPILRFHAVTSAVPSSPLSLPDLPPNVRLERGTSSLALPIARRLVSQQQHSGDVNLAAQRLVASASAHGIDFTLTYATLEGPFEAPTARQACLAVLGAGRTAMLYVSEPLRQGDAAGPDIARTERARCVLALCSTLGREHAGRVALAQSLPDPAEHWSVSALQLAGFQSVGTLLYMRRQPRPEDRKKPAPPPPLPVGMTLVRVADIPDERRNATLVAAMDASYQDTLDCPLLCGLRETRDILTSHQSTGTYDPGLWWLVMQGDAPLACLFLSPCPEQRTTELVYLGLAKPLRGRGIARALMQFGIAHISAMQPSWPLACAVDEANTPAVRLYDALGFRAFARRIGLVKRVGTALS